MKLTLRMGQSGGAIYEFAQGEVRIGRDPDNDIVFGNSSAVSRKHAKIQFDGARWQIVDLNSTHGTQVNRRKVADAVLQNGDELQFGPEARLLVSLSGVDGETLPASDDKVGQPSESELFPPNMGLEPIKGKGFLIPGFIAAVAASAIHTAAVTGNIAIALGITQALLAVATVGLIYYYCGKTKPLWVFIGSGIVIGVILAGLHFELIKPIRNLILPLVGQKMTLNNGAIVYTIPDSVFWQFVHMLFLAAIPEELEKIVPAALGLWLFYRLRTRAALSPLQSDLAVREPLDGILLGVAAAAGFSVFEGVHNPILGLEQVLTKIASLVKVAALAPGANLTPFLVASAHAGIGAFAEALFRGIGDIAGHQAYSGIFGYYVGLAALYPAQKNRLLLRGFLTAITLHTLWNTVPSLGTGTVAGTLIVTVCQAALIFCSLAVLISCILQARKISPTRASNFATVANAVKAA